MTSDVPEIPPEVANRKTKCLTAETASLIGEKTFLDDSGRESGQAKARASAAAQAAEAKARKYAGPYPLAGLTPEQIHDVRGIIYPDRDQPKMDPESGDRTPDWVNWLWAKYPWDAAKRFGGSREVWPTKLPAVWPPARSIVNDKTESRAPDFAALLYTQADVDALLARGAQLEKTGTVAGFPVLTTPKPKPKPKRIRNRSKKALPATQPAQA
jgi:hypothetical protein